MKTNLEPKPLFLERMKKLLGKDFEKYLKSLEGVSLKSLRVNTLKISPADLKKRLEKSGWRINQPFKNFPEIMVVESELEPGEFGRSLEHQLGYYYIQDIASMLPPLVLNAQPGETVLDLCASPGSKTTQIASNMKNQGTIIANEISLHRIKILASNLERCGVTNAIITKKEGFALCNQLKKQGFMMDKILVDAPCSGEGTIISSPKTLRMWNIKTVFNLSKMQKSLLSAAIEILKPGGEIIYSTCTHSPEEDEEIVDFILKEFPEMKIEKINLPVKFAQGITNWKDKEYTEDVKYSCRIYPHETTTEGFFVAKLRKEK
jgi:tRNA (cytosine49-C5)-methyltransferase